MSISQEMRENKNGPLAPKVQYQIYYYTSDIVLYSRYRSIFLRVP